MSLGLGRQQLSGRHLRDPDRTANGKGASAAKETDATFDQSALIGWHGPCRIGTSKAKMIF
jgi:hypothetical protein